MAKRKAAATSSAKKIKSAKPNVSKTVSKSATPKKPEAETATKSIADEEPAKAIAAKRPVKAVAAKKTAKAVVAKKPAPKKSGTKAAKNIKKSKPNKPGTPKSTKKVSGIMKVGRGRSSKAPSSMKT